jgi:hypothetical protein
MTKYLPHPLTGEPVVPLGIGRRGPIWPILGAEDPPADPPVVPPAPAPPPPVTGDPGFPADTPVADMTDKQQAAYWKHQSRKHENTVKTRADYDAVKAKAAQFDQLEAASRTEQERAIEAAKAEARQEALREAAPRMVSAEFRAAAKGVLTAEQVTTLLEDLDLNKYLTDKGEVDVVKVEKKVTAFAPTGGGAGSGRTDMGQGRRPNGTVSKASAGVEEARRRFGEKQSANSS